MNYYETLFIVHPALESGRLKDIITGVEDNLKKLGGNQLSIELWGKKKLSYLIDKQKYGTYVLLQFSGEGKGNGELAVELEHNPNILAYLTTSIEEGEVIEQEEDLDTQIAGKSREAEKDDRRAKASADTSEEKTTTAVEASEGESAESTVEAETEKAAKEKETSEPVIELTEVSEESTETVTEDKEGNSEDGEGEAETEEAPTEEDNPEPEPEPEVEETVTEESVAEEIVPEPEAAASEDEADSEPQEVEQKEESKEAAEETATVKGEE